MSLGGWVGGGVEFVNAFFQTQFGCGMANTLEVLHAFTTRARPPMRRSPAVERSMEEVVAPLLRCCFDEGRSFAISS